MNIVVTSPHSLLVIICWDVADSSAENLWILTAPGSTLRSCDWVSHLITSLHLVTVGYLCLGIGNPGKELARVVWVPDSAGCLALYLISIVGGLDEDV